MDTFPLPLPTFGNPHVADRWLSGHYAAAFVAFEALGKGGAPFAYVCEDGIDKVALLEAAGVWSYSEQILVKAALDLFDPGCVAKLGHTPANSYEILVRLDRRQREALLTAARLARVGREAVVEYLRERAVGTNG